ncbi:MAG: M56 family metallopeptidase, partial [Gemmatimonadetes bacterium]|nr:M56 family metallopeptidase [Gemmatimonadota bacterium]
MMLDATTTELFPLLADTAVRGVVLLALTGLVTLALWKASAALRHLVWSTALVGLLALPAVRAAAPEWPVLPSLSLLTPATVTTAPFPELDRTATSPAPSVAGGESGGALPGMEAGSIGNAGSAGTAGSAAIGSSLESPSGAGMRPESEPTAGTAAGPSDSMSGWLFAVWLTGLLLCLAPVAAGWVAVRRLGSRSRRLEDTRVRYLATRLALRIGLRRPFRLLVGPSRIMPMTWGLVRPKVVLPPEALEWPESRLEAVLLHELAHVARRDCLTQMLAELARAVHWFNPLVWV